MKKEPIVLESNQNHATITDNGICPTLPASMGAGGGVWCIGNGQLHDALSPSLEVSKTLNCMDDPMKILIIKEDD